MARKFDLGAALRIFDARDIPVLLPYFFKYKERVELYLAGGDENPVSKPTSPNDELRVWSGMRLSLKGVKRDGKHVGGDVLRAIKSLDDPVVAGDVVNFDIDPLDQFDNEIGPGSPELEQLLYDAAGYDPDNNQGGEENHRIGYQIHGGNFAVNGTYRQYGCGPNVKIPREFKGELTATLSAFATTAQAKHFVSNGVAFRVKS